MFGSVLLFAYRALAVCAALLPKARADALKARWALRFSVMTDGGLDDDFAEEFFQLVRGRPDLLAGFEPPSGAGFLAMRRRMTIETVNAALASGRQSLF